MVLRERCVVQCFLSFGSSFRCLDSCSGLFDERMTTMFKFLGASAGIMVLCIVLCWKDFEQGYASAQKPGPAAPEKGKPQPSPAEGDSPDQGAPKAEKPRGKGDAKKGEGSNAAEAKRQFDHGVEELHGRLDALKTRMDKLEEAQLQQWEDRIGLREKLVEHGRRLATVEFGGR